MSRRARRHAVHAAVFAGICCAALLDRYFGLRDAALVVSLATNGLWVFHG